MQRWRKFTGRKTQINMLPASIKDKGPPRAKALKNQKTSMGIRRVPQPDLDDEQWHSFLKSASRGLCICSSLKMRGRGDAW